MAFVSVKTYSYRNLIDQKVELDASRIFLIGANGQGKSNFLESIYLLSYGNSFRTNRIKEVVQHGQPEMALHGSFFRPEEEDIGGTISFRISNGEKSIFLNEKKIQDRKQLISYLPAIVFSHDDISFVNGPPDRQRWFFNQIMSLFDPMFIDTLRDYRKILKMRNNALKNQQRDLIPVYNQQLSEKGLEIQQRRTAVIAEFNRVVAPIFHIIADLEEAFSIEYRPSWKGCGSSEEIFAYLSGRTEQDLLYSTTTSGTHRDRFIFRLGKKDFSRTASTGQLRLMSLILRIGQSRYFSQKTGRRPILLLDDVLLELDGEKRKRFLKELPEYEQIFFTFLPDERYLELADDDTSMYQVENGCIQKMKNT